MMIKIGHAAKDERDRYSGGKSGDQTKREVYTRTWYNRPWGWILRAKDPKKRERIASAMEAACYNNYIGYDQNQRNTLLKMCRMYNYYPGAVTQDCECDCSSLVSVCCMHAGIPESVLYRDGNCATTSTLKLWLMETGEFEALSDKRYLASPDYLLRGDIMLYSGHHVAVCLEDGAKAGSTALLRVDSKGGAVRRLQEALNQHGAQLDVDGEFGQLTEAAVMDFQRKNGLEVDGVVGKNTRRALGM